MISLLMNGIHLTINDYHQIAIFGDGAIDIGCLEKWKNSANLSCINYSKLFGMLLWNTQFYTLVFQIHPATN